MTIDELLKDMLRRGISVAFYTVAHVNSLYRIEVVYDSVKANKRFHLQERCGVKDMHDVLSVLNHRLKSRVRDEGGEII
jgi:hypothetical protein